MATSGNEVPEPGRICIFAKPPRSGQSKTRLSPMLPANAIAMLAEAFLRDTLKLAHVCEGAEPILAHTGRRADFAGVGDGCRFWPQGEGDLGDRLERVLARALTEAPWVIALGSDAPTLPLAHLRRAAAMLSRDDAEDAVLGPADDGGFVLLGLRTCPAGLLHSLPWSTPHTADATRQRLEARGYEVAVTPGWYDVDTPDDLRRLMNEPRHVLDQAHHTSQALARLRSLLAEPQRMSR